MTINKVYQDYTTKIENRIAVLYGGAGSGKSYAIAQKILIRVWNEPNSRILVIRKVAKTLRSSVFQMFKDLIVANKMDWCFKINKSDMTIENIANGSQILMFGLDDVEKLKSIAGITSIWIEEASEITEDDYRQLNLRLRGETKTYKQITLSFNPINSRHWLKKHFIDNPRDFYILKTTYLDNKFIDEEYKKELLKLKNESDYFYNVYALGNWGNIEGTIYNYNIVDKLPEYSEFHTIGLDFGYNHPMALVECKIEKNNVYFKELFYETEVENRALIEWITNNRPDIKKLPLYPDTARPDLISEFRNAGFNIKPTIKDVFAGIMKLQAYNIFFTKDSINLINEADGYAWKKDKNGGSLDEPVKLKDDGMDACRYSISSQIKKISNIKTFKVEGL